MHLASGIGVAVSGVLSGVFIVVANAWMNSPAIDGVHHAGFDFVNGKAINIDPLGALMNPMAFSQTLHMALAAYAATGFMIAGVHAFFLLKDRANKFHRCALGIALVIGGVAALLQPISGDFSAQAVAKGQPIKLAALEGQFKTEAGAPLRIGGFPDMDKGETNMAIEIPYMLSVLAYHDPHATVKGLNDYPRDLWPNSLIVHLAFEAMVGMGSAMALIALIGAFLYWRKRALPDAKLFLYALVLAAPAGMIAIEAGWTVTEVGRQPWIVQGVLRTADAVTPMPGIVVPFVAFGLLYLFLGLSVVWLLGRQVRDAPTAESEHPGASLSSNFITPQERWDFKGGVRQEGTTCLRHSPGWATQKSNNAVTPFNEKRRDFSQRFSTDSFG